jgi:hypothetical protein
MNAVASDFRLKNTDNKSHSGFGLSLGNSDKLEINENFALQGEFLLHYRTSELSNNTDGIKNKFSYWGAEVPVYVVGQLKTASGKFFIGAGSYIDFGFNAKIAGTDLYKKDKTTGEIFMKRWDYGCGIIGGYEFKNNFFVNIAYRRGFSNLLNTDKADASMKSQVFSLGLGYRFPLFSVRLGDKFLFKWRDKANK